MTYSSIKASPLLCRLLLLYLPRLSWSLSVPTPTAADVRFDSWCDQQGIYRVGVQTVTCPQSLGGRGLFATRQAKAGTVLASIPSKLAIIAKDDVEWQVSLTNQVTSLLREEENEWIQSWHEAAGSLRIASLLEKGGDEAVQEYIDELVEQGGKITREGARTEVQDRLDKFHRRLEHLQFTGQDAAKWYSLVVSRAAYMGKDWDYRVGALPFFDMLNHCHDASQANTELMTFGDCLDRQSSGDSVAELDRRDMLLVLTRDVDQGGELLTQYETDIESEQTQVQLLIQYGIPPPPL